jgi:distribution and morphology protein 31
MLRGLGLKASEAIWRTGIREPASGKSLEVVRAALRRNGALDISWGVSESRRALGTLSSYRRWRSVTGENTYTGRHVYNSLTRPEASSHLSVRQVALTAWRRHAHTRSKRRRVVPAVRHKSTTSDSQKPSQPSNTSAPKAELSPDKLPPQSPVKEAAPTSHSILGRLPHIPSLHRPSKEELLGAATGAWSRFNIHFKWFSIRSFRPWNIDDISAFFTWIIAGHVVWILVGTTTFFSLIILLINTVFAQETLARWIGNYLTQSGGIHVVFESAVVPKWGDGVISFSNVFVSRRPGQGKSQVKKGSPAEAAAAAALSEGREPAQGPSDHDDGNYTQFDVSMDTVNVTLSFAKWFNGKGLLRDVEIKGVRGVIDRTHINSAAWAGIDPRSWRHEHQTGDFELDSFKMEDMLVTVHQPENFRPFSVSIHLCELPKLRKQWLFYDFLSANVISGSYDNAMFAIHPRQEHNYTGATRHAGNGDEEIAHWKKHARFRIDGLGIEHLNRGSQDMFAWIKEGKVDIVSDMMFPSDDESIAKVMSDFYDRVEATVTSSAQRIPMSAAAVLQEGGAPSSNVEETKISDPAQHETDENLASRAVPSPTDANPPTADEDTDKRFMVMDVRVQLNDVRATVPFFTADISYVNNALIRPIVAYINSRRAFIPVNCRVVKKMTDFDGSWSFFDSGLMDDLSREVSLIILKETTKTMVG